MFASERRELASYLRGALKKSNEIEAECPDEIGAWVMECEPSSVPTPEEVEAVLEFVKYPTDTDVKRDTFAHVALHMLDTSRFLLASNELRSKCSSLAVGMGIDALKAMRCLRM